MAMTDAQRVLMKDVEQWLMSSDDLMGRVEAFAKANCSVFAGAKQSQENKVEYTIIFEQYSALIEHELEAFLASKGASQEQFVDACSASVASAGSGDVGATDFITAMTDFNEFKQLMTSMC